MFQNTNVVFLNTFNAILNIMDANACVPSVEFIYSAVTWDIKIFIEQQHIRKLVFLERS